VLWPVKNNGDVVVGISQTDHPDPRREPWSCSAFLPERVGYACVGFVWQDGVTRALPTLGGTHGFATSVNNRKQIVGWAETTVEDPTCSDGQVLQFRAVRWEDLGARPVPLSPLSGDSVSAATAINDRGRVVGISGACDQAVGRLSARAAVVWDHGHPRQLADLGGIAWNTPMSLNEHGEIVGFLNRSEDDGTRFRPIPAWWTAAGVLHRLELPEGFMFGQALGINARRQIVGVAFNGDFTQCTAVMWVDEEPIHLGDHFVGAPMTPCSANDINVRGEISGQGVDHDTGQLVAYLARPLGP
jgi:uncharacterized membrane protein